MLFKNSIRRRHSLILVFGFSVALACSGYILLKFRNYEDSSTRMLSGQEKTLVLGHLIEARLQGAQEMIQLSVTNQDSNEAFAQKIATIGKDLRSLAEDRSDTNLTEAEHALSPLIQAAKTDGMEDLFVHYRNIKAVSFNLYRMAWNYKWMNVAKSISLVMQDLDNLPYHSADKASDAVLPKITALTSFLSQAPVSQESKVLALGQLNQLKASLLKYGETLTHSERIRAQREGALKKALALVKNYNDNQAKSAIHFTSKSHDEYIKSILALSCTGLFLLALYFVATRRFSKYLKDTSGYIAGQLNQWIQPGGSTTNVGFVAPPKADQEWDMVYQSIDHVLKKVSILRREDQIVKRLVNAPYMLVNRSRQAMFWNSPLSILLKVRTIEDMGATHYSAIFKAPPQGGKATSDPVEKSFLDRQTVVKVTEVNIGNEKIPIEVVCTPVMGADQQVEYVLVHFRDLRDEYRRVDAELNAQISFVIDGVLALRRGEVPAEPAPEVRKAIAECLGDLRAFALDLQEHRSLLNGQLETAWERLTREGGLKKSVYGRMEQVADDLQNARNTLTLLQKTAATIMSRIGEAEARNRSARNGFLDLHKSGKSLQRNFKSSHDVASRCLKRLESMEDLTKGIRSREQLIRNAIDKSAVINANNSILRSHKELSTYEISSILDSINHLSEQFERGYKFIQQSVFEMESEFKGLVKDLKQDVATNIMLSQDDKGILGVLENLDHLESNAKEDFKQLTNGIAILSRYLADFDSTLQVADEKCKRLVQVGKASIELQGHIEKGFQGLIIN